MPKFSVVCQLGSLKNNIISISLSTCLHRLFTKRGLVYSNGKPKLCECHESVVSAPAWHCDILKASNSAA